MLALCRRLQWFLRSTPALRALVLLAITMIYLVAAALRGLITVQRKEREAQHPQIGARFHPIDGADDTLS